MGSSLAKVKGDRCAALPTFKVLVVGDVRSGKTAIIRRYTQNQFIAAEPCTENKLVELTAHSVQLPGIQEVVSVVFWEIPAHSFNLVKEEQYKGSDAVIVVAKAPIDKDLDNVLSLWKQNILKDSSQRDLPFILLHNRFQDAKAGWLATSLEAEINTERNDCKNRYEVHPYSGDDSVHKPLDRLLWELVEEHRARTRTYPTSDSSTTHFHKLSLPSPTPPPLPKHNLHSSHFKLKLFVT